MQALYALALTPITESLADTNSYRFREKRSVADAIAQCFNCLAKGVFSQTEKGTPQDGIISPVIANMALDRLETTIQSVIARRGACINVIRYADDFIITGATPEILMEEVKPLVETFLGRRGLRRINSQGGKSKADSIVQGCGFADHAAHQGTGNGTFLQADPCRIFRATA